MPIGNALAVIRSFRPFPPVIIGGGMVEIVTWVLNTPNFNYLITAENNPTSFGAAPLPAGLAVNTTTGAITGTPTAVNIAGTNVTISAINKSGIGSKQLIIKILPPPPVITSILTLSGIAGTPLTYNIIATNMLAGYVASYGASNLPAGLTVNTTNGLINGTPINAGVTNTTISAINAGGSDTKILIIDIKSPVPVVRQPENYIQAANTFFEYQIIATNNPISFIALNLPDGLSLNSNGRIIGTLPNLTTNQIYTVYVNASNSTGLGIQRAFTITVVAPPEILAQNFSGWYSDFIYTTATLINAPIGSPIIWDCREIVPAGQTIKILRDIFIFNGEITVIPGGFTFQKGLVVPILITASTIAGTATKTVEVTLLERPAPRTAPKTSLVDPFVSTLTFKVGSFNSFRPVKATGEPTPTWYVFGGLPAGLSINSSDGTIYGTPTASQFVTGYRVTATNSLGEHYTTIMIGIAK